MLALRTTRTLIARTAPVIRLTSSVPRVPVRPAIVRSRAGLLGRSAVEERAAAEGATESMQSLGSEKAHAMGRYFLGGTAAAGLGAMCFYGVSTSHDSATAQMPMWPPELRQRIHATYAYMGGGLALTSLAAAVMYRSGVAHRMMTMHPLLLLGGTLVGTLGTMSIMQLTPSERTVAKHAAWLGFNSFMGLTLAPLCLLGGPILAQAAVATGAALGGLSLVAMCSPSETFLYMGGVLGLGLGLVVLTSLGSAFLPVSAAARGTLHVVSMYGGVALFGCFVLYDTQRVIRAAEVQPVFDPINHSLALYLDAINMFVRIAQIMAFRDGQRRR